MDPTDDDGDASSGGIINNENFSYIINHTNASVGTISSKHVTGPDDHKETYGFEHDGVGSKSYGQLHYQDCSDQTIEEEVSSSHKITVYQLLLMLRMHLTRYCRKISRFPAAGSMILLQLAGFWR